MRSMANIGRYKDVPIFVHWSAMLIVVVALLAGSGRLYVTLSLVFCFAGILLIHEIGHTMMAHRVGTKVLSISLYPIHGRTTYDLPWSELDDCRIAWGGVIAQSAFAFPIIAGLTAFGYPKNEPLAAALVILGPFNAVVAVFNLLPFSGLDGAKAWNLIPLAIKGWWGNRRVQRRPKSSTDFRRW
jgi:Zn-dependent protease